MPIQPLRFTLCTIGSTGDLESFLALGVRLEEAGHSVRIATLREFRPIVEGAGLGFLALAGEARPLMRTLYEEHTTSTSFFHALGEVMAPLRRELLQDAERACAGTDVVVYTTMAGFMYHAAEARDLPVFRAFTFPMDATRTFPVMTAPVLPLTGLYNYASWWLAQRAWGWFSYRNFNRWRADLGLRRLFPFAYPYARRGKHAVPTLYAFSQLVVPKPAGWGKHIHLTAEWKTGRIKGAIHIPLNQLSSRLHQLPHGKTIVTVCRSGHRSALAARTLTRAGHDVLNLKGGIDAWARAGLPLSTTNKRNTQSSRPAPDRISRGSGPTLRAWIAPVFALAFSSIRSSRAPLPQALRPSASY